MSTNEWETVRFENAPIEIIDGDRGNNYPHQSELFEKGFCLFLNAGNVTKTGFSFEQKQFITKEKDQLLRKGKLQRYDFILTTRGTVGNVAHYDQRVKIENIRINSGMVIFRITDMSKIDGKYFYQYLRSESFKSQVLSYLTGSAQPQLPIRDINRIEIPLPPLPEQRAIADVLSALDDKIELNRRMNQTLEELAQTLFKHWFIEKPDEDYKEQSLDQVASFLNGLALQKYPPIGEKFLPVIKIAQLRTNNIENTDRANIDLDPAYIVNDGDVLFSWSGSLMVVLWCGGKGALNQHLFKVTSDKYPKWFYYLWIKKHLSEFQAIAEGKATTMGHIQRHHLSEAKVLVPNKSRLDEMTEIIEPLIDKIILNNMESRTLAELRDTLLPKLMSGQVRVNI